MATPSRKPKIHIFGHEGAGVSEISHLFSANAQPENPSECDLAIFAINPAHGIDQNTIALWEELSASLLPRIVVVTGIESPEADFDDAVLLANRVFDRVQTPFLVLHDDAGVPCALISLDDLKIYNYESLPPIISESDPEHKTLVTEFRKEYFDELEMMGPDGFVAGLVFPAIPLWIKKNIGVDIVKDYISQITALL